MTETQTNETTKEIPRISIKWIASNAYVYTWSYIRKAKRDNEKKRFEWTYVGPLSGKGGEYIRSHSINEETIKNKMFEKRKLAQIKIRRSEISNLPRTEKRRNEIEEIRKSNPSLGKAMSEELQEDIKSEAIEFVELMFEHFTSDSFYEFFSKRRQRG